MRKRRLNKSLLSKPEREFEMRDNKKYEVKTIVDSAVYSHKVEK